MSKWIKNFINKWVDKIFPITNIRINEYGQEDKSRDYYHLLRMANVKIKNFISKSNNKFKSFLPQYGWITFFIIVLVVLLLSIKLEKNLIWLFIIHIVSIKDIPNWFEALGTFIVAFLAVHPIHQKTNIGVDTIFDTKNVGVQLLNRNDSSTFVKLRHVYICDEHRTKCITVFGDLNQYYTDYTRWIPLASHKCNTLWIIKNNDVQLFKAMYPIYCNLHRLDNNLNMHYIEFIFSVNDHHYDIASKAIDVDKIYSKFCKRRK